MGDVPWESEEGRNYICIRSMLTNVVSEELRKYFKQEWNMRYQASFGAWDDTSVSCQQLFNRENSRPRPSKKMYQSKFQHGDTSQWDCSVLFDAIRFSNSIGSSLNPTIRTALDDIRAIRNQFFGHSADATLSNAKFQAVANDIEDAFKILGFPVHHLTQIRARRNLYKSFQVLSPMPTHEVVYRTEKTDEIKEGLENLRSNNNSELTYFYISGNPGSGKSQLARQLGEDVYKGVNWSTESAFIMTLDAKNVDTLINSYEKFCRHLNCNESVLANLINSPKPKKEKIKDLTSQITTRIKNWKRWWIIVDNVEDLDIISPLLPQMGDDNWNNGQIILTTQNTNSVPSDSLSKKHISLSGGMNGEECRHLLSTLSGTSADDPVLDEVAKQLDHQPLSMAAAAVYVKEFKETKFSWRDYLEKLGNGKRHVTEKRLCEKNSAYSSTMSVALYLAVTKSAEKCPILRQTFNLFTLISFEPLPIDIIVYYIQHLDQECDKEEIYLAIKHCSLFLIESQNVRLHRVVYEAVTLVNCHNRNALGKDSETDVQNERAGIDFPHSLQTVLKALYCFKGRDDENKIIPHLRAFHSKVMALFPTKQPWYSLISRFKKHQIFEIFYFFAQCLRNHCEFTLALQFQNINLHLYANNKDDPILANISSELCLLHFELGKFVQGKEHGHRALEIQIKTLGPTHVNVGVSYNNLGAVYQEMGELKKAKDFYRRALEIKIEGLGPTHVNVGVLYNNLGAVYQHKGEFKEAKDYYQRALEIKIKALHPTHVDVGLSYNNLGAVYQDMGDLKEAKHYYQRALEIEIKALGTTHVNVGVLYNNLGAVYKNMGELAKAKDHYQRALEIKMKALGSTHVQVGLAYNNLGALYMAMGELKEAKNYYQRALPIKIKALGPTHVNVGLAYNNLGAVYQDMGELGKAEEYYQRALEITTNALDPTHVDVGLAYNNLGAVYKAMGKLKEAKDYYQRALEIKTNALSPTHVDIGLAYNNLGAVYKAMGDYKQTKDYYQRALEITINALGPTHVDVGLAYNNLGAVYKAMGKLKEAKDYYQRALEIKIKALGPTHLNVGQSYNNLGAVYLDMGELSEARDYYQRALEITLSALGPAHVDVGVSYNNLGAVYQDLGELKEAEDYYQRALEITTKVLGTTHVNIGVLYNNLGAVYQNKGERRQAKDCYQRALEISIKALGPTHVDVGLAYNNLGAVYQDMGELEEAKDSYQRALDIKINALGPTHSDVGVLYNNLGAVYKDIGELKVAESYYQRALDIILSALGPTHVNVGVLYNNLCAVYKDMGKHEKAKDYYQRALEIKKKH